MPLSWQMFRVNRVQGVEGRELITNDKSLLPEDLSPAERQPHKWENMKTQMIDP